MGQNYKICRLKYVSNLSYLFEENEYVVHADTELEAIRIYLKDSQTKIFRIVELHSLTDIMSAIKHGCIVLKVIDMCCDTVKYYSVKQFIFFGFNLNGFVLPGFSKSYQ